MNDLQYEVDMDSVLDFADDCNPDYDYEPDDMDAWIEAELEFDDRRGSTAYITEHYDGLHHRRFGEDEV